MGRNVIIATHTGYHGTKTTEKYLTAKDTKGTKGRKKGVIDHKSARMNTKGR
jgi:hypothetical protein